ncbi:MAG: ribosome biogenesis GTPase Der, partial [Persephonella sp.]
MYRVAIVGRPNVGKSSLFNRIIGKRKAIVEDIPGITRDRIVAQTEWNGIPFEIVDTGGYLEGDEDKFASYIRKQIEKELEQSDAFIFVVDGQTGLTPADKDIANLLHKTKKPVYVVVNKIDNPNMEHLSYEFYELGFDNIFPVSVIQKIGIGDLLDKVVEDIPDYKIDKNVKKSKSNKKKEDYIKVALVGKPNAGKSSLFNAIVGEERAVVSDIPGTTRDVVDTIVEWNGNKFLFLDTAGLRKKSRVNYGVEFFSVGRTLEALKKADVVVLVIDAEQGATEQDTKIAHLIQKYTKPAIIVINKIDKLPPNSEEIDKVIKQVREKLYFIPFAPIILTSAKNKKGIKKLLKEIKEVYKQSLKRVKTSQINKALQQIQKLR